MKHMIWLGLLVGSTLGGLIPSLWGEGMLSFSSILFSALGGAAGIYVAYKMTH